MADEGPIVLGVDVAAGGDAQTVVAVRVGWSITDLHCWREGDTTETVKRIASIARTRLAYLIIIDATGVGAGPFDQLRAQGLPVMPFNGAETAGDATDSSGAIRFANKRAHAWWHMRELLHPMNPNPIALPNDPELVRDLIAPHYKTEGMGGRLSVERKTEIVKRIGRSPDKGDAVVMSFYDGEWANFEEGYGIHTNLSMAQLEDELRREERARERELALARGVDELLWRDLDRGRWMRDRF